MENPDSIIYSILVFVLIVGFAFLGLVALLNTGSERRGDEHEDNHL